MAIKRKHIQKLKLGQINNFIQLIKHFRKIFLFIGLKLFRYYSKVVQQINNKQKVII